MSMEEYREKARIGGARLGGIVANIWEGEWQNMRGKAMIVNSIVQKTTKIQRTSREILLNNVP